jgi:hypothetical protein
MVLYPRGSFERAVVLEVSRNACRPRAWSRPTIKEMKALVMTAVTAA